MCARVLVVGAGIGGLTTAIALLRAGLKVDVVEQFNAVREIGAGVTLAPNAMRVYQRLGLDQAIMAAGVEPTRQRIQHWEDGRTLVALDRGASTRERHGAPYLYVHRADLQSTLLGEYRRLRGADIALNSAVVEASVAGDGAIATLSDGRCIEADAIVGADGVKSAIRRGFEADDPHFTGHVAWRALVAVKTAVLEELAAYPGVHIGPGRMMVRYPVRGSRLLNIVCFARQTAWEDEGWMSRAELRDLRRTYAGWCPEVQTLIDSIDPASLFKWGVFARKPLSQWSIGGRIGLLGDAAHAMTPFMGQGAACAIEDALVLSRAFQAADDPPQAFARYQAARKERCDFIQQESNENADRLQGQETDMFGLGALRNEESLGLFDYDAGAVPV